MQCCQAFSRHNEPTSWLRTGDGWPKGLYPSNKRHFCLLLIDLYLDDLESHQQQKLKKACDIFKYLVALTTILKFFHQIHSWNNLVCHEEADIY
ncbi:hypothetical protein XELAEV_18029314mg [Xenopus laevis]|uniref:Uncharacterized protein n=1 Tax=Xenopus laevis TaxID=8355 RepID=A0A974CSW4_XENLA|nr:hypothetical protein XELAEV_18029314mg [Xenopus laevis]